jgi:hypothetical protein
MMTAAAFRKLRLLLEVAQNTASEKILAKRPQERMGDSISLVILNGGEAGVRDLTESSRSAAAWPGKEPHCGPCGGPCRLL